ncbi:hypothetical protein SISSUDRAFT_1056715 [Sistotremastrum suecicum HHB10207 ss-3]|uniref:NAD(+) diphosphatase n=1 Tax=Sistotremastrum suecicum HHB10207 ss-3 TaxID=1314776 RepID=A0A166J484_9AGAM|nr:hypothetical protein SISSUDRAFT_1056715 [Sistotremastrum suecicum HHB10207 ss-3]
MAENYVNFLAGNPLNRLSWLRSKTKFLEDIIESNKTQWIVFKNGYPLATTSAEGQVKGLASIGTSPLVNFLGPKPFFGQGQTEGQSGPEYKLLEGARIRGRRLVFLGVHEPEGSAALPSHEFINPENGSDIQGQPWFSIDIGDAPEDELERFLESVPVAAGEKATFVEPRGAHGSFSPLHASIFAEARSMVDWNNRNKFCPACGSPNFAMWAGWKLTCSTLLPWADNGSKAPCPSGTGLQNFAHPRTDPVVIMAVLDQTGEKILLGRNKRFPNGFVSCLAGFLEPGETIEEAVQREIWEEAGIRVSDPYPANLMLGCYATADASQTIRLDLDNELAEARFYTKDEVRAVLAHRDGAVLRRNEYKRLEEVESGKALAPEGEPASTVSALDRPSFRVPPISAVAGVLITEWVNGRITNVAIKSSNL